jgi:hypothetical protein
MELTEKQWSAVLFAREALRLAIEAQYPSDAAALECVATAGLFADMCRASASHGTAELLRVINEELASAGLQVVKKKRH